MTHQLLSATELAHAWGVQPKTVRRWHREGLIAAIRTPTGGYRFPPQSRPMLNVTDACDTDAGRGSR